MLRRKGIVIGVLAGLLGVGLALSACKSGVPQQDLDALKQQLSAKEQEVAKLRQDLQAAGAGGQQVTALQQQLSAKEKELAAAQAKAKNAIWFQNLDAKPRATPTPRPPGVTPPPPPTPPAARTGPIFFYVDTVTAAAGESKYNVDASVGCARTGIFKRGMRIVWRMEVVDTSSGKVLQAADVQQAVLKLAHGENLNMAFGRHGATEDSPWFWAVGWDIPPTYPLGGLKYTIEVTTKDGKVGTFKELTLVQSVVDSFQSTRPDPERWKMTDAGLTIIE